MHITFNYIVNALPLIIDECDIYPPESQGSMLLFHRLLMNSERTTINRMRVCIGLVYRTFPPNTLKYWVARRRVLHSPVYCWSNVIYQTTTTTTSRYRGLGICETQTSLNTIYECCHDLVYRKCSEIFYAQFFLLSISFHCRFSIFPVCYPTCIFFVCIPLR